MVILSFDWGAYKNVLVNLKDLYMMMNINTNVHSNKHIPITDMNYKRSTNKWMRISEKFITYNDGALMTTKVS